MSLISGLPFQAGWFSIVLILCFVTAVLSYGVRQLYSWQAWTALALFYMGVAASNAWQFVPRPVGELAADPEAQRLWFIQANEAVHQAKMMVRNLAIGFCALLAFQSRNAAPTLTLTILIVWFGAELGESVERFVCKANDPAYGYEHEWLAAGERRPSCGRAFGGYGPVIFPLLTVTPLPFILWRTRVRIQKKLNNLANWKG